MYVESCSLKRPMMNFSIVKDVDVKDDDVKDESCLWS